MWVEVLVLAKSREGLRARRHKRIVVLEGEQSERQR